MQAEPKALPFLFHENSKERYSVLDMLHNREEETCRKTCRDRIFVLSLEERDIFPSDDKAACGHSYWMRTISHDNAYIIREFGTYDWTPKTRETVGVRPVMWVDLN